MLGHRRGVISPARGNTALWAYRTDSYDGNGNLTNISYAGGMGGVVANLSLPWNMFGQLASSTHQNGSVNTFGYDMFGERSAKNGSTLVSFGGNRGGDLTVGLDSFVQTESGAKVIQNHRGDISALSSADGTGAGRVYDPYGNLLNAWTAGTGTAPTSVYGFTGAEELGNGQTTDLVYMRARYYHPGLGRFISQDPIGFAGGTNLYAYCGNDPINFTDPLGLSPMSGFLTDLANFGNDMGAFVDPAAWGQLGNAQIWADGLDTGLHATGSALSFGLYDGGSYRCQVGFNTSFVLGSIGREAATQAATLGLGNALRAGGGVCGIAAKAGQRGGVVGAIGRFVGKFTCFTAGTPVLMADGSSKAIENVKAGDLVLSKDEKTGEIVKRKVVETKVRTTNATLVVEVAGGGRVETTAEHPFYVDGKGWTPAGQLAIGNAIVTRAGPSVKVTKIEKKEKPATVYNFEVEGTHSYFVGNANLRWLWVHNDCYGLLMKGGKVIGRSGDTSDIRVLKGGVKEAEDFFLKMAMEGGQDITPSSFAAKGGMAVKVPEGTISFRPVSKSGPPTINVTFPNLPQIRKIKFLP